MMNDDNLKNQTLADRLRAVALTGGVSGGIMGGATGLLSHGNLKKLPLDALKAALLGGTTAAGAVGVGEAVLGEPEREETNVYTKRGGTGGAAIGALAGLLGTIALSGKLPLGKLGTMGKPVQDMLNVKNPLLARYKRALQSKDLGTKSLAAAGGIAVPAVAGGYFGADEGMGLDILQTEMEAARAKRRKEQMLAGMR